MTFLSTLLALPPIPAIFTACAIYIATTCIYRLYLHPLSRVPGPKLAALTLFYEAWYNLFAQDGRFIFHAENLHKKYGPIVRIAPNEVSISDPDFYNKVHYPGSQFEKDPVTYEAFGFGDSIFNTRTNELHAKRRAPIKDYFSRRSILAIEPVLLNTIKKFLGRIDAAIAKQPERLFDIQNGLRATSVDMSTTFSFNFPLGMLDMEDLGKRFSEDGQRRLKGFWVVKYFPWLPTVLSVLPKWLEKWVLPAIQSLKDLTMVGDVSISAE
jgi:hypothetical protein